MEEEKKKRRRYSEGDDAALIELWEIYEPQLRKAKRNSHIYAEMALKSGGKFTPEGIHTKIKNLSFRYRQEKKQMGPSGGSPSTWVHYNSVHRIIGSNAANNSPFRESFSFQCPNSSQASADYNECMELDAIIEELPSTSSSSSSMFVPLPLTSPPLSSPSSTSPLPSCSKKEKKNVFEKYVLEEIHRHGDILSEVSNEFKEFCKQQKNSDEAFIDILKKMSER